MVLATSLLTGPLINKRSVVSSEGGGRARFLVEREREERVFGGESGLGSRVWLLAGRGRKDRVLGAASAFFRFLVVGAMAAQTKKRGDIKTRGDTVGSCDPEIITSLPQAVPPYQIHTHHPGDTQSTLNPVQG